jgi:hypothetical protein
MAARDHDWPVTKCRCTFVFMGGPLRSWPLVKRPLVRDVGGVGRDEVSVGAAGSAWVPRSAGAEGLGISGRSPTARR